MYLRVELIMLQTVKVNLQCLVVLLRIAQQASQQGTNSVIPRVVRNESCKFFDRVRHRRGATVHRLAFRLDVDAQCLGARVRRTIRKHLVGHRRDLRVCLALINQAGFKLMHEVVGKFRLRIEIGRVNCQCALEQIFRCLQSAKGKARSFFQGQQIQFVGVDLLCSGAW